MPFWKVGATQVCNGAQGIFNLEQGGVGMGACGVHLYPIFMCFMYASTPTPDGSGRKDHVIILSGIYYIDYSRSRLVYISLWGRDKHIMFQGQTSVFVPFSFMLNSSSNS